MLKHFSAYGFLKNQRYFEPFIILFFIENGLSFAEIGILIAIRELFQNLFEIPSGALADSFGRKRVMVFSFIAYLLSFLIFSLTHKFFLFAGAMFFFGIGDAFRTGTHKAIIFKWLEGQNKGDEKTYYYGYTRSWSKYGSAFSVIISVVILFMTNSYRALFLFSMLPYMLGLINFFYYPPEDHPQFKSVLHSVGMVFSHFKSSFRQIFREKGLSRLFAESMNFEGGFKATKDYIQPVVQNLAILLPLGFAWHLEKGNEYLSIGIVYIILYLLSGVASRKANWFKAKMSGEEDAALAIWRINFLIFALMLPALIFKMYHIAVLLFVLLYVIQNFWRPILITRISDKANEKNLATVLSIESQAKSIASMILAPSIGFAVDWYLKANATGPYWPVAFTGVILALPFVFKRSKI